MCSTTLDIWKRIQQTQEQIRNKPDYILCKYNYEKLNANVILFTKDSLNFFLSDSKIKNLHIYLRLKLGTWNKLNDFFQLKKPLKLLRF